LKIGDKVKINAKAAYTCNAVGIIDSIVNHPTKYKYRVKLIENVKLPYEIGSVVHYDETYLVKQKG